MVKKIFGVVALAMFVVSFMVYLENIQLIGNLAIAIGCFGLGLYLLLSKKKEKIPKQMQPISTNYCEKCGAKLETGSNFCEKCGSKIINEPAIKQVPSAGKKSVTASVLITLGIFCLIGYGALNALGVFEPSATNKISEATGLSKEQSVGIYNILLNCGFDEFESITHDELLDDVNDENGTGYRITTEDVSNVILYLKEDGTVSRIRWADNDFYVDGSVISNLNEYTMTSDEQTEYQLKCETLVKSVLSSPSTADFPLITKWGFDKNPDRIIVQSYVDAQNTLGATVRSDFQIVFSADGSVTSFIFNGEELKD